MPQALTTRPGLQRFNPSPVETAQQQDRKECEQEQFLNLNPKVSIVGAEIMTNNILGVP